MMRVNLRRSPRARACAPPSPPPRAARPHRRARATRRRRLAQTTSSCTLVLEHPARGGGARRRRRNPTRTSCDTICVVVRRRHRGDSVHRRRPLATNSRTPASVAGACVSDPRAQIGRGRRLCRSTHTTTTSASSPRMVRAFRAYNVDPDVVEPVSDFFIRDEASVPEYARIPEYESSPDASSPDDAEGAAGDENATLPWRFSALLSSPTRPTRRTRRAPRGRRRTRAVRTGTIESRPSCAALGDGRRRVGRVGQDDDGTPQIADLSMAPKTSPDAASNVVDRFYAVDAVVDLLCPALSPRCATRASRVSRRRRSTTSSTRGVRVLLFVAREEFRRRKSEGPRRVRIPPSAARVQTTIGDWRRRGGRPRARGQGLPRRGQSRRVRRADSAARSSARDLVRHCSTERSVEAPTRNGRRREYRAAKAIDALAKATLALLARDDGDAPNANASASGSFFSLDDDEGGFETIARGPCAAGFADVAEEVADWVVVDGGCGWDSGLVTRGARRGDA